MAEASFILPTAETMSFASGSPVAPANAKADGIFAGMLAQRLQPQVEAGSEARPVERATESSVATAAVTAPKTPAAAADAGQASPPSGKDLPQDADSAEAVITDVDTGIAGESPLGGLDNGSPLFVDLNSVLTQTLPTGLAQSPVSALATGAGQPAEAGLALTADNALATADQALLTAVVVPTATNVTAAALTADPAQTASEQRAAPVRPQSNAALQLTKMIEGQANAPQEAVRQPAASLGLAAANATAEQLRNNSVALTAEQALRQRAADVPANQALTGDSLSRQFQQQIDRLLLNSGTPAASNSRLSSLFSAPSVEPLAGVSTDSLVSTVLPNFATDLRAVSPGGLFSGVSVPVATPVGQPAWSSDLGQRMVWLANQEIREAQIQLNPRNLGPIDVRIVYSDTQQLSVSFNAQNPAAREALDAALPRLREMFEQQGLSLGDASVSQESFAQQQEPEAHDEFSSRAQNGQADIIAEGLENDAPLPPPRIMMGSGLVDTFA